MSDKTKSVNKSVRVCWRNTPHQRSEQSAILHLSNEYVWMMILVHWEWRAGWPSLMQNRAACANTHIWGRGGFFASCYSHSIITFDETWALTATVFLSRFLAQMFYLIGWEGWLSRCCHRNRRRARLSHHSFVMLLVLAQFERSLDSLWMILPYR